MSSKQASEIPPEDKISLSPLDKYRIYGKFPYHMIIHIKNFKDKVKLDYKLQNLTLSFLIRES